MIQIFTSGDQGKGLFTQQYICIILDKTIALIYFGNK